MPIFKNTLKELEEERGFTSETVLQKCLMLGEEVGELFKAVRKKEKMKIDSNSKLGSIDEELADIIIYLVLLLIDAILIWKKLFAKRKG